MDDDPVTLLAGAAALDQASQHLGRNLHSILTPARQPLCQYHQRILGEQVVRGERRKESVKILSNFFCEGGVGENFLSSRIIWKNCFAVIK